MVGPVKTSPDQSRPVQTRPDQSRLAQTRTVQNRPGLSRPDLSRPDLSRRDHGHLLGDHVQPWSPLGQPHERLHGHLLGDLMQNDKDNNNDKDNSNDNNNKQSSKVYSYNYIYVWNCTFFETTDAQIQYMQNHQKLQKTPKIPQCYHKGRNTKARGRRSTAVGVLDIYIYIGVCTYAQNHINS